MAPGIPTAVSADHQPTKTVRIADDGEDTMQDAQETVIRGGRPGVVDNGSSDIPSTYKPVDEDDDSEQVAPYFPDQDANKPTTWGFHILDNNQPGFAVDNAVTEQAEDGDDDSQATPNNSLGDDTDTHHTDAQVEGGVDGGDGQNGDQEAGDDGQAVTDSVAADVAAQAAAADADSTQNWLVAQDSWLNQLAAENPEEFARLVESGVVDPAFIPHAAAQENIDGDGGADGNTTATGAETEINSDEAVAAGPDGANDSADAEDEPDTDDNDPADNGNATATAPNTDHFVWLANRNDAQEENTSCPACDTAFSASDVVIYLNCGHSWCSECVNLNYRSALRSRSSWPPQCCRIDIDHGSIAHLLEEDLQMDLVVKIEEFADNNPVYCQTPKCAGGYIPVERREGQWAGCQTCRLTTCVECKAPAMAHPMPALHPNMIEQVDKELAEGQGWKQCPGCRNLVERSGGCNYMSCECGHHFCYQCGGTLENNMPCDCEGQQPWVAQMNQEAAGGADQDGDSEDEEGEDGERDENEDGTEDEAGDQDGDEQVQPAVQDGGATGGW